MSFMARMMIPIGDGFAALRFVIPGRAQRVRPEVAGPMAGSGASPESIPTGAVGHAPSLSQMTVIMDSGLAATAAIRNDFNYNPDSEEIATFTPPLASAMIRNVVLS
jgi:hypothetical protein